ncbi:hypothetical protein VP1G_11368 [Cytospora mali]|uniref:Uncharacterized protein n=1 Tax=Cytospora mali TaxID=578113 RepID=A0A194VDS0_CYTMA|nr:hypothetical protein VP1G_11368 [Valsa mali var. pyri (nom. inval.)]
MDSGSNGSAGDEEEAVLVETKLANTSDEGLGLNRGTELLREELVERLLNSNKLLGMLLLVDLEEEDVQTSTIEQLVLHRQHLASQRQAVAVVQDALGQQVGHDVGEGDPDNRLASASISRLGLGGTESFLESSNEHHGAAIDVFAQLNVRGLLDGCSTSDLATSNDVEPQQLQQSPGLDRETARQVGLGKSSAGLMQLGRVNASLASNAGLGKNRDNRCVQLGLGLLTDLNLVRAGPDTNERAQAGQCSLVSPTVLLLVDLELLPPKDLGLLGGFSAHGTIDLPTSSILGTGGGRAVDLGLDGVQRSEVTFGSSKKRELEARLLGFDGLATLRSSSILLLGLSDKFLTDLDSLLLVLHIVALAGDGNDGHGRRQGDIGMGTVDLGASIAVLDSNLANLVNRDLEVGLKDDDVFLVDSLHKFRRHVVLLALLGESDPHRGVDRAELGPALLLIVDLGESDSCRQGILADDALAVLVGLDQLEIVAVGTLETVLHAEVTHNVEGLDGKGIAGTQGGLVSLKELLVNSKNLGPLLRLLVELDQLVGRLSDEFILDLQARTQRALKDCRVQLLSRLGLVGLSVGQRKTTSKLDSISAVCLREAVLARAAELRPDLLEQLGADLNGLSPLLLADVEAGQCVACLYLALNSDNSGNLPSLGVGLCSRSRGGSSTRHNLTQNGISLVVFGIRLFSLNIRIDSLDLDTTLDGVSGLCEIILLLLISLLLDSAHDSHGSADSRGGSLLAGTLEVSPYRLEDGNGSIQDTHGPELLTDFIQLFDDGLGLVLSHVLVVEPDTVEDVLGLSLAALATQEASVGNADLDLALMGLRDLSCSNSRRHRSVAAVLCQTTPKRNVKLLSTSKVLLRLERVRHAQGGLNKTNVEDIQVTLSSFEDRLCVLNELIVLVPRLQNNLELHSSGCTSVRERAALCNRGLVDIAVYSLGLVVLLNANVQLGKLVVVLRNKSAGSTTTLLFSINDVYQELLTLVDSFITSSSLVLESGRDIDGLDGTGNSELVAATEKILSNLGGIVEVLACVSIFRKPLSSPADCESQNMRSVGFPRQRLLVPAPLLETGQKSRAWENTLELSSDRRSLDLTVRVEAGAAEVRQPVASGVLKQGVRPEEAVNLAGADGVQAAIDISRDTDLDIKKETSSQILVCLIRAKESNLAFLFLLLAELQKVQANRLIAEANSLVLDDDKRPAGAVDILDDVGRPRLVNSLLDVELKQRLDFDRGEWSLGNKQPADDQASITTEGDGANMLCQNLVCSGRNLLRKLLNFLLVTEPTADKPSASHVLHVLSGTLSSHGNLASRLGPRLGQGSAEKDDADIVLVLGGDVIEVLEGLKLVGLVALKRIQAINDQDNILKTLESSVKSVPECILSVLRAVCVGIKLRHSDVANVLLKELQQESLNQSDLRGLGRNLAIDRRGDCLVLMVSNAALQSLEDPVKEEALTSTSLSCDGEDTVPAASEINERAVEPLASELSTGSASGTATGHQSLKLAVLGKQPLPDGLDRDVNICCGNFVSATHSI